MLFSTSLVVVFLSVSCRGLIQDETQAQQWLDEYNTRAEDVYYHYILGHWTYSTNLTQYNQAKAVSKRIVIRNNLIIY
jgi:hypothetical protein